jgi:hypothetical protein
MGDGTMQTELKSGAVDTAGAPVGSIQSGNWRVIVSKWLQRCLAEPPLLKLQTKTPFKQRWHLFGTCALIFLTAFGVRLLQWQDMRVETLREDSIATTLVNLYEIEAKRMEEDGGVLFPSRPIDPGDARMLVHPPGYSILLRGLYGTQHPDNHYFALRMIQVVCDALAALLLFLIAVELFPFTLSVIAGMLAALSPHHAYYSLWLSPDSLVVLPILLGVLFFIKASKQGKTATLIAAGICLGLACWLRSNPLLLAPLFAAIIFVTFERGKRLRSASVLLLAMMVVISPITIRNWVVYHRFIPVTIVTGLNLVQGLAEFDKDNKFGLPPMDADAMVKDAEWHNRPDYARNLFVPDGVERDQYRFKRGVEVIRENPGWFAKGLFLRMAFMLRYNDFRSQNNYAFTSIAPTVLPRPSFGYSMEVSENAQAVWSNSADEMFAGSARLSKEVDVSVTPAGRLRLITDGIAHTEQLSPAPIVVKPGTDYIMTIPVALEQGRADLKIRALDQRFTLQSKVIFNYSKKNKTGKNKKSERSASEAQPDAQAANEEKPVTLIQMPFSSGNNHEVRFVIANNGAGEKTILETGEAQLFEIGKTPYQWTQVPRSVVLGLQKNIFKTDTMRLLILLGILLLAFARRQKALLILLAVPLYYLGTHAAFSTEYRYILALHFFLFVISAATLYVTGTAIKEGVFKLMHRKQHKPIETDTYAAAELGSFAE